MNTLEELNIKRAHRFASDAKERLKRSDTDDLREQIVETARSCGHKDVWISVFKDDNDMVARLIYMYMF